MKRSHPKAGLTTESWRDVLPLPALPMLLAATVYARTAGNGFALDDRVELLQNRFVTGPFDLAGIFTSDFYGRATF